MATTAVGVNDYTNAYKKVLASYIQDNIPDSVKLLKVIKKADGQFINNTFYAPVRTSRQSGIANLANDKAKLVTGNAAVGQASINVKYLTAVFDITDPVNKASRNKEGAVESALSFQMKTLKSDFAKNVNRQYASDGYGVLSMVLGSVSGTSVSVTYPTSSLSYGQSGDWYGTINNDIKPTKFFTPGQVVAVGSAGTALGTISSITTNAIAGTGVVNFSNSCVSTANDPIFAVDGDGGGAGTSEIEGFRKALSSGTADYAGIARSNDIWSPQILGTASNGALSIADMDTVYSNAYEYSNEGDKFAWFVNKSLYNKFGELLTALRRTVDKTELVSGWSGLSFEAGMGNVGVFLDYEIPDGEAVLLNLDTWKVVQIADMGFIDEGTMNRRPDYISYQNTLTWYTNLLCVSPASNGRMLRRTR